MSPFQCAYGYQPPLFPAQADKASFPSATAYARRCRRTWAQAQANLLLRAGTWYEAVANQHRTPPPRNRLGQCVWLSTQDLPLWGECRKMAPRFVGPFPIVRVIIQAAVRLKLPWSMRVHPTFHVSRIKLAHESPLVPDHPAPPPPQLEYWGPAYTVSWLLCSRPRDRGLQHLVDWEGYGPEERASVLARHILDKNLIRDFCTRHPEQPSRPRRLGRARPRRPEPDVGAENKDRGLGSSGSQEF